MKKTGLVACLSLLLFACDKVCSTTVNDVVTIKNTTGTALQLSACKSYGINEHQVVTLDIPNKSELTTISAGTHDKPKIVGGLDASPLSSKSCEAQSETNQDVNLKLMERSGTQYRFCQQGLSFQISAITQTCPSGFTEVFDVSECK